MSALISRPRLSLEGDHYSKDDRKQAQYSFLVPMTRKFGPAKAAKG